MPVKRNPSSERALVLLIAVARCLSAQPAISPNSVLNATGYQNKLAPDTVFAIFGTGLGPASLVTANAPNYPLSLAGTSVSFTPAAGGAPIPAKMIYTVAGQVAGLLPSSVPPGDYAVHVTYNGQTSAPQNVTVVARSFGIATATSSGTGTAQATIGNVNRGISLTRFTSGAIAFGGYNWTLGPAHAGDTVVLWGTGTGADPANDTGGTSGDQTAAGQFAVLFAGRRINPQYAGASSGYPGLGQINFVVPPDMRPDCFASVQVSAGGELSNLVSIPVAAPGQTSCSDPDLSPDILAKLDAGGDITLATFVIARILDTDTGTTIESGSGVVARNLAARFALGYATPRVGNCRIYDRSYPVGGTDPSSPIAFLDAGVLLPLTGPGSAPGAGLGKVASAVGPAYVYYPSAPFAAGPWTLAGNGGSEVGPFQVTTDFPSAFTVTNWHSITSINRSTPLNVSWTGSGFRWATIIINTNARTGSTQHIDSIQCTIAAGAGSYAVPPEALAYALPGTASLSVQGFNYATFTAPLVAGGQTDLGLFGTNLGVVKSVPVQ